MERQLVIYAICVLVGILIDTIIVRLHKSYGVLKIDRSNPDKDKYLFEIDNLDELSTKKLIVLKVDNNADLSQK